MATRKAKPLGKKPARRAGASQGSAKTTKGAKKPAEGAATRAPRGKKLDARKGAAKKGAAKTGSRKAEGARAAGEETSAVKRAPAASAKPTAARGAKSKPASQSNKSASAQADAQSAKAPKPPKKASAPKSKGSPARATRSKATRDPAPHPAENDPVTLLPEAAEVQSPDEVEPEENLTELEAEEEEEPEQAIEEIPEPVEEGIGGRPTDELWILYRELAVKRGRKSSQELEELRNVLIERHYPLVRYIAERLLQTLPKSIELDDLVSAGLFGLMDAIRGFDPDRGIKFKTYCSTRIRGAILDQLRSQDWVPRLVRLKASRIEKALQRLTAEYGREPTHAELARTLEMEHTELSREIQEARAKTMFSLSEKWEDDDGSVEKVEVLEDKNAIDPVHELNRRDLMSFITRALTHKERFIIEQYYQYGHTMREIGEMLALTESRVCQIHSNVMGRLKGLLGQRSTTLMGG